VRIVPSQVVQSRRADRSTGSAESSSEADETSRHHPRRPPHRHL